MLQTILVYIVFATTLFYFAYRVYKTFTHKKSDGGCSKCEH